jgi:hypothetical protein
VLLSDIGAAYLKNVIVEPGGFEQGGLCRWLQINARIFQVFTNNRFCVFPSLASPPNQTLA